MGRKKKKQLKPWCWYPLWLCREGRAWVSLVETSGRQAWLGPGTRPGRARVLWCLGWDSGWFCTHGGEARRSVALGSVTKEQLVRGALGLESPQVQTPLGTRVSAVSWRIPERDLSLG